MWKTGSLAVSEIAGWISRATIGPSKANSGSQFISELVLCSLGPALENVFQGWWCHLKQTPRELYSRLHTQVKCSRLYHCEWLGSALHPWEITASEGLMWQPFREHPWVFEWGWNTFPSSIQGPGGRKRKNCSSRNQTIYVCFTLSLCIYLSMHTYIHIHLCV